MHLMINLNFLSYLDVGEEYELNFHKFQIIEFIPIMAYNKIRPRITTIYFGFGLLMLSIFLSYRSFSQIWLNKGKNTIFVGGRTNRAQLSFEKEIFGSNPFFKTEIKYGRRDLNSHNKNY